MTRLTVDLYQSTCNPDKFLAVPAGVDPAGLTGPVVFDADYGGMTLFRSGFEFDASQTYGGVNAAKVAADILTVKWSMYAREK